MTIAAETSLQEESFNNKSPDEFENAASEDGENLNQIGVHLTSVGNYKKAQSYFAKAVATDVHNVGFQMNLANAYYYLGELRLAYQVYDRIIEANPDRDDIRELHQNIRNTPHICAVGALQGSHAPQRQVFMSAALNLFKNIEPPLRLLEIGSYMGSSLLTWANAAEKLYGGPTEITCVDPWGDVGVEGYVDKVTTALKSQIVYEVFRHNAALCPNNVSVLEFRGPSQNVLPNLKENHFDIIYVDGCHFFKEAYGDIVESDKLLKVGGIICGDDLEMQFEEIDADFARENLANDYILDPKSNCHYHPGVTLAVHEYFGEVSNYDGFWIMRKTVSGYEKVSLQDCVGTLPIHWTKNFIDQLHSYFAQSKAISGIV